MKALLDKGAEPERRGSRKKVWYRATTSICRRGRRSARPPFWRAAYAADVDAMKLLVAHGADPNIPTMQRAGASATRRRPSATVDDVSALPPVPLGGPGSDAARTRPRASATAKASPATRIATRRAGCSPAVKYLVEELHADVNAARSRRQYARCTTPPRAATTR